MTYRPPDNSANTLRVHLGYVAQGVGTMVEGSAVLFAPGVGFTGDDVGRYVMVYYAGTGRTGKTNAAPLVSTISSVTDGSTAVLADVALSTTPQLFATSVVLFRPKSCKSGTISYQSSITVKGSGSFTIQGTVGGPSPVKGQPFLITDTDTGALIGGFILTVVASHFPGSGTVEYQCDCTTFASVLGRIHLDSLTNNPGGRSLGSLSTIRVDTGGSYISTSNTVFTPLAGVPITITITSTSGGVTANAVAHVGQMEPTGAMIAGQYEWRILTVQLDDAGIGYRTAPTVGFSGGSAISQATGTAILQDVSLNAVQFVTVNFAGLYGNSTAPTVTIDPPPSGGRPATAHAVMSALDPAFGLFWQVDKVVVDDGGAGYVDPPAIHFSGGTLKSTPIATASLVAIPTETGGVLGQTPNPLNGTFLGATAKYIIEWILDNVKGGLGAAGLGYGTITDGPVIRTITFDYSHTVGSAFDSVVSAVNDGITDYVLDVDPFGRVSFQLNTAVAAPWSVDDTAGSDGNALAHIEVTNSLEKFVLNATVNLQAAVSSNPIVEKFSGDNTTKSFNVTQGPLSGAPTISIISKGLTNSGQPITVTTPVTVALQGTPEPVNSTQGTLTWYWSPGSSSIQQATSGKPLGTEDTLVVTYLPTLKTIVTATADPTVVGAMVAIAGGAGAYFDSYVDNNNSGPLPIQDGQTLAQSIVNYFSKPSTTIKLMTYRKGLVAGSLVTIHLVDYNVSGDFLVTELSLETGDNMQLWTTTLAAGAIIGDWRKAIADLTHSSSPFIGAGVGAAGTAGVSPNVPVVYKVTKVVAALEQSGTFTDSGGVDRTIVNTHFADDQRGVHVVVDVDTTIDPVLSGTDSQPVSMWLIRNPANPTPTVVFLGQFQLSPDHLLVKLDRYSPDSIAEDWQIAVKFGAIQQTQDYTDAVLSEVFNVTPPQIPDDAQAQNAHFGTILYGVNDLGQRTWGWMDLFMDLNYDNPDNKSFSFTVQKGHITGGNFIPASDYEGVERQFADNAESAWVVRTGNSLDILGPPVGGFPIQSPLWTYPDDTAVDRVFAFRIYGEDGNGNKTLQRAWSGNTKTEGYVTPSVVAGRFTGQVPGSQITGGIPSSLITGTINASQIVGIVSGSTVTVNASQIIGVIQASQILGINASQIIGQIIANQISYINANQINGSITAGQISSITAGQITGLIQANQIAGVNASVINGTISAGQIGGVNAGVIAGTINASQIGGVNASQILGVIAASQISSIAASQINGSIAASQIGSVNASQVVGSIQASQINSINASQVIGTVTASFIGTLAASQITGAIVASQIGSVSASLIVGAIVASQINTINASQVIGAVTTSFIGTLAASQITGLISAAQISTINASQIIGTVTASFIGTLAASQITGVITASQINNITAAQITGVVVTSQLAAGILNSLTLFASNFTLPSSLITNIQASQVVGLITALQISSITASQLTGLIQASQISRINASQIAGQIAASNIGTIAASQISGSIAASNIGAINASSITGNITINQISAAAWGIGVVYDPATNTARVNTNDPNNIVFNPQFDFGLNGFVPDANISVSPTAYSPPSSAKIIGDPSNWHVLQSQQKYPCTPGTAFISGAYANGQSANAPLLLFIYFYNAFDQVIGSNFDKNGTQQPAVQLNQGSDWSQVTTPPFYAPAGATYCRCLWVSTCTSSFNFWLVDNVIVLKGITSNQVLNVNASVINGQIAGSNIGTINASQITGQIAAGQIGSVASGTIIGQLVAGQIATINANQIQGSIQASQIGAINATAITGSIQASQIGTVFAGSISGFITAGQISTINASTVTIGLLQDNQIGGVNVSKLIAGTANFSGDVTFSSGGGPSIKISSSEISVFNGNLSAVNILAVSETVQFLTLAAFGSVAVSGHATFTGFLAGIGRSVISGLII